VGTTGQSWYGCVVPSDLLYDVDNNVWVRFEGDEVVLGMTDVAQTMCGRFVQVTWKAPGRTVQRGRSLAIIESAKWVGPFPTPLTGRIVADNRAGFAADVLAANRDPYGAGWLYRLRPDDLAHERGALVDGATAFERYKAFIEENDIRCFRCAD
jgi:glycine cleavage system H protein